MKYRTLGKTGLRVSVVGLGTWQFGGEWGIDYEQRDVDAIVDKTREVGINLIDTAECYGDHLSESLVGRAIARDRDNWVVATKFGHFFHSHMNRTADCSVEAVRTQLEASLAALQTDRIDLYQFHSGPDEVFDQPALWQMLNEQVEAGKIRHLGISIGSNDNLHQTDAATEVNAEAIQVVYNRLNKKPEERVFPSCRRQQLGVLARVPLASGFLSGKYKPGATFPANDVRAGRDPEQLRKTIDQVQEIAATEVPDGVPMAPWALAWCLQHEAVTCVIPGCKNVEQVASNASASDLDLVRDDHPQACPDPT